MLAARRDCYDPHKPTDSQLQIHRINRYNRAPSANPLQWSQIASPSYVGHACSVPHDSSKKGRLKARPTESLLPERPLVAEEFLQNRPAIVLHHSSQNGRLMIETDVGGEAVQ